MQDFYFFFFKNNSILRPLKIIFRFKEHAFSSASIQKTSIKQLMAQVWLCVAERN